VHKDLPQGTSTTASTLSLVIVSQSTVALGVYNLNQGNLLTPINIIG